MTVFGVESTCKLTKENLENKDDFPVIVDVTPSMPLIQVSTTLPKVRCQPPDPDTPQAVPLVTAVTLYAGQRWVQKRNPRSRSSVFLEEISGFHLISNLTFKYKCVEKVVATKICSHVEDNSLRNISLRIKTTS